MRRDNFTEFTVGLSQDLPRTNKRRLKGERKQLDAETERAALNNDRRAIRRDASLAWLDVYEAEQGRLHARRGPGRQTIWAAGVYQNIFDGGGGRAFGDADSGVEYRTSAAIPSIEC